MRSVPSRPPIASARSEAEVGQLLRQGGNPHSTRPRRDHWSLSSQLSGCPLVAALFQCRLNPLQNEIVNRLGPWGVGSFRQVKRRIGGGGAARMVRLMREGAVKCRKAA